MSYDSRLEAQPHGAQDGDDGQGRRRGSVRAARERLQAAQIRQQLPDRSKIKGLPQRSAQSVSQNSSQSPYGPQQQSRSTDRMMDPSIASPPIQWPLSNNENNDFDDIPIPPRSPMRLQPPHQTIRLVSGDFPVQQPSPDYSPTSFADTSRYSSSEYPLVYQVEQPLSPTDERSSDRSSRPLTTSTDASGASSLGPVPDFPVPLPPLNLRLPRRLPSLGPPPSSRRGPSSYYTQMSYVSPIVEESETRSNTVRSVRGSFASSNVFPMNNDDFYSDDGFSDDDDTIKSESGGITPVDDRRRLVQPPAVVREASLGQRSKPSLTTIRSVENTDNGSGNGRTVAEMAGLGAVGAAKPLTSRDLLLSNGTGLLNASSSPTNPFEDVLDLRSKVTGLSRSASPKIPIMQDLRPMSLANRVGMRRPPRLDVNAVREAEARGSLTSLPDLIRRATRLAANLDRGKTASRLSMEFWDNGALARKNTRPSGLSDMLAAFPPVGQGTPSNSDSPNATGNGTPKWPLHSPDMRNGAPESVFDKDEPEKKRRKCFGLPLWMFIFLVLILFLIFAAAVTLPLVLHVIPNQQRNRPVPAPGRDTAGTSTAMTFLPTPTASLGMGSCISTIDCRNGGAAIMNTDRTCNCICANGFTGRTCTNNDAAGCASTSIDNIIKNATAGSGIPRLIQSASTTYNVPLNSTRILATFSNLSLSCASENALITFNGLAARSITQPVASLKPRSSLPRRTVPVFESLRFTQKKALLQNIATKQQKETQHLALRAIPVASNLTALDFARVGVLFVLQESGALETAANAQTSLQTFLTNNKNGDTASTIVDLQLFSMDMVNLTMNFKNGTTIRATPASTTSSKASITPAST